MKDDDKDLFRRAMEQTGVVRQVYRSNRIDDDQVGGPGRKPRRSVVDSSRTQRKIEAQFEGQPTPVPVRATIDQTEGGNTVHFARAGINRSHWKRLKRGTLAIEQSIDLHGMRSAEASGALSRFIVESVRYGSLCVEIIHGKGLNSEQPGGVLRPLTLQFLKQQPDVLAFCSAPATFGGAGATLVLLSQRRLLPDLDDMLD